MSNFYFQFPIFSELKTLWIIINEEPILLKCSWKDIQVILDGLQMLGTVTLVTVNNDRLVCEFIARFYWEQQSIKCLSHEENCKGTIRVCYPFVSAVVLYISLSLCHGVLVKKVLERCLIIAFSLMLTGVSSAHFTRLYAWQHLRGLIANSSVRLHCSNSSCLQAVTG